MSDQPQPSGQNNLLQNNHFDAGIWRSYQSASIPPLQRITSVPQAPVDCPTYSQFTSSSAYPGQQPSKSELLLHQHCCDLHHIPKPFLVPPASEQESSSWFGRIWNWPALPQDYRANAQMLQGCRANYGPLPIGHCPLLQYGQANTNIDFRCDQANAMLSQELERKSRATDEQQLQLQLHSCQTLHQLGAGYNKLLPKPEDGRSVAGQHSPDVREQSHDLFRKLQHTRVEVHIYAIHPNNRRWLWKTHFAK